MELIYLNKIKTMAKKKDETAEEVETNKGVGQRLRSTLTQRERNLLVKQELIDKGERKVSTVPAARSIRERNLAMKLQNKKSKDEKAKDEKGKGK